MRSKRPGTMTSVICAWTRRELREQFEKLGWQRIVAFQTRNPMHRAHLELTLRAAQIAEANLLIHPIVGMTKPGDIDHYTRVRCLRAPDRALPGADQHCSACCRWRCAWAGPREALWHAIIRKNYGCTHFIVGRDHAGPGKDADGNRSTARTTRRNWSRSTSDELDLRWCRSGNGVRAGTSAQYVPADEVEPGETVLNISGTELRRRLHEGLEIPDWFTYPEVIEELRRTHPPRHKQGSPCSSPAFPAPASRPWPTPCWSACSSTGRARLRCSMATSCASTCPASSAFPRSIAT